VKKKLEEIGIDSMDIFPSICYNNDLPFTERIDIIDYLNLSIFEEIVSKASQIFPYRPAPVPIVGTSNPVVPDIHPPVPTVGPIPSSYDLIFIYDSVKYSLLDHNLQYDSNLSDVRTAIEKESMLSGKEFTFTKERNIEQSRKEVWLEEEPNVQIFNCITIDEINTTLTFHLSKPAGLSTIYLVLISQKQDWVNPSKQSTVTTKNEQSINLDMKLEEFYKQCKEHNDYFSATMLEFVMFYEGTNVGIGPGQYENYKLKEIAVEVEHGRTKKWTVYYHIRKP